MNTSSRTFTIAETALLSRGLNFCPTTHFNLFGTILDVNKFSRSLTLKKHFFTPTSEVTVASPGSPTTGESVSLPILFPEVCALQDLTDLAIESDPCPIDPTDGDSHIPFKLRSEFYPVGSRGKDLDLFQKLVERDLTHLSRACHRKHTGCNLSKDEIDALKVLSEDKSITIRNSDKGGTVVILDSSTYSNEALRQLSDIHTYSLLKSDPTVPFSKELTILLDRAVQAGIFTAKERDLFIPVNPIMPIFHHLPKIHKGLCPLVGRPIVAGIGSLNERLGDWVDSQLQPLVLSLPGYLRDTKDLLNKLHEFAWSDHYRWISCDVTSLYSSIPHHLGIEAVKVFLKESGKFSLVLQEFICQALEYLLKHNFFMFDGGYYLQKCGASMGAKFSPSLANLYMGWWERSRIFGCSSPRRLDTAFYCRYIDDLLFIINDSDIDLDTWLAYLNDNCLNLKFTGDLQTTSIEYLDVRLSGIGGTITTSLHRKKTAGNALLRADSAHPGHTINAVPYGQFLRLKRLCSSPEDFSVEAIKMSHRFRERGYPIKIINRALSRASTIPRDSLLSNAHTSVKNTHSAAFCDVPVFSTPYSSEFNGIKSIVNKYLPILYGDTTYQHILEKGIKTVSRRAPTLGSKLSPSLFQSHNTSMNWLQFQGTFKCGTNGCRYCKLIKTGQHVHSCSSEKSFPIKHFINCNTKFVIYVIGCSICKLQYVGRTTRRLKDRLRDHLYDIDKNHDTNVARHWNITHCKDISSLTVQGMEKMITPIRGGDKFRNLCRREVFWIFSLHTRIPRGLNFEWDVSHFYD